MSSKWCVAVLISAGAVFSLRAEEVIVVSQTCASVSCDAEVGVYAPDGTQLDAVHFDAMPQEFSTDVAFDADRNIYVLDGVRARIFDPSLDDQGRLGGKKELLNSIVFDSADQAYVGVYNFTKKRLRKYDSRGLSVAQYKTPFTVYSADLAADQCTLYYVADPRGPQTVHRYNVCAGTPLSDFGQIVAPNVLQIRLLPDGGLLVAGHTSVQRYDASARQVTAYDLAGSDYWRAISITGDQTAFWAATRHALVKFDLATGDALEQFTTSLTETVGVAVRGEWRAAASTPGRPVSPVDLVAKLTPDAKIELTWADRADDESGYELEYQVRDDAFKPLGTVGANTTRVIVTVPNNVLVYTFRVRAFNAKGVSGYSNTARVPEPDYEHF